MSRTRSQTPSAASWRQNALDLIVEACRLVAALGATSPAARRRLEDTGFGDALDQLQATHPGPLVDLAALLAALPAPRLDAQLSVKVAEAIVDAELPPPWTDPPAELLERLAALDERARVALRHHALVWGGSATPSPPAPPLTFRDHKTPAWPSPEPALVALQEQARRRVTRLLALPETNEPSQPAKQGDASAALAPPSASLSLGPRQGLTWTLGRLPGLPPDPPLITLRVSGTSATLLASNLRTGKTALPVGPSVDGYRLEPEIAPPLPGLSAAQASAFRVRADGGAAWVPEARLRAGERWRLLVPPSLAHVALPEDTWLVAAVAGQTRQAAGWRAFDLLLARGDDPAQSTLLTALGLTPPALSASLRWVGVAPARFRLAQGDSSLPVFASTRPILVRASLRGRGRVVLTSAYASVVFDVDGDLDADQGGQILALEALEPGAYSLDLQPYDPASEPAHRAFFVEAAPSRLPAAAARARFGPHDLSLRDDPALPCALRGDERVTLTLPPHWPVQLRWEGSRARRLGRWHADRHGEVDLSGAFASLARHLTGAPVADVIVDAGELGSLTLHHERPFAPEAALRSLVALLAERGALLSPPGLSAPDLLRVAWVEPVCRVLGYELSALRQAGAGDPWYQILMTLRRSAQAAAPLPFEELRYAVLVVSREPPATVSLQRALVHAGAPRAIWTDGLRWRLVEQGRRDAGETFDLDLRSEHAASVSLGRLVARLGV